ncbi:ABC transporter ATP-binding protein [Collinsella tanakaei]|nr:ABC transporter ATP-binding protein [Collinsella tanakaei]
MMNPYASAGSVSTVTASVSGNDNLNADGGGAPRGEIGGVRLSTGEVTRRLLSYIRPHAVSFSISFVSAAISVVLQLYTPILIGRGIDLIIDTGRVDFDALLPLVQVLAIVVIGAAAFQWLQGYCVNRLCYETVRDMRIQASEKLGRMPLSFIDSHPHGDLISRVVNDVDQVGDGLLQGFTQLFTGVVTILGTLVFMLTISVPMAIVVVLVTPASVLAASLIAKFSNRSFNDQQRVQGQLGGYIEEYVGNQRLVDAFAHGDEVQDGFDTINGELYVAGERAQFLSSLSNPGTRFINNLIYAVVAVIGCVGVITGVPASLTVGEVQTFLSYANQYTKPFNEVTSVITQVQTAYASARRLFALLDAVEEQPDAADAAVVDHPQGGVSLSHVDFSYVKDRKLLQDICIDAKPGMRFALVGPTGCGKTTLINLLLRFYDVDAGRIELDGVETRDITRASLRRSFGMVLQDTWLFEGTVHDNIAYGKPDATREEVIAAARRAHADKFIAQLPQGYDTVIGEDGGSFSAGQKQLLCIARVMLTDPAILLLDEATSSIDTRTELQVQAAFDELMDGRTSFVVAHRLSTIRNADCILYMRDGQILERGTHDELLALGGSYAELYNSQFSEG